MDANGNDATVWEGGTTSQTRNMRERGKGRNLKIVFEGRLLVKLLTRGHGIGVHVKFAGNLDSAVVVSNARHDARIYLQPGKEMAASRK